MKLVSVCGLALFSLIFPVNQQNSAPPQSSQTTELDTQKQSAVKLTPGTYYWNGTAWTMMLQINSSGGGLKHVGKMFVPGLTPQMVYTFRDPQAPVQLKQPMPMFCVKFIAMQPGTPYAPTGRDIVVVRFDEKKDHRELQTTNGGSVFTFKSGLSKDRMPDIEVSPIDAETYLVSPKAALATGEYLLSASTAGVSGYDFGFHPPK